MLVNNQLATSMMVGIVAAASIVFFAQTTRADQIPEVASRYQNQIQEIDSNQLQQENTVAIENLELAEKKLEIDRLKEAAVDEIHSQFPASRHPHVRLIVDSVFKVATEHTQRLGRGMDVENIASLSALQLGLIQKESGFTVFSKQTSRDCGPYLRSVAGACGIKQIIPKYHNAFSIFKLPAAESIPLQVAKGFEILLMFRDKAGNNLMKGLQLYNGSSTKNGNYSNPVIKYAKNFKNVFSQTLNKSANLEIDSMAI